jgi:hypothetical protein
MKNRIYFFQRNCSHCGRNFPGCSDSYRLVRRPKAGLRKEMNEEGLLQLAIDSSSIFHIDHAELVEKLVAWEIFNWGADEYSLGGYAYNSLGRRKHLNIFPRQRKALCSFQEKRWVKSLH